MARLGLLALAGYGLTKVFGGGMRREMKSDREREREAMKRMSA